jgi:hypothetical protein
MYVLRRHDFLSGAIRYEQLLNLDLSRELHNCTFRTIAELLSNNQT